MVRSNDLQNDPRYGNHPCGGPPGELPVRSCLAVPVALAQQAR
jgi:GAF domain-containing protein